MKTITPNQHPAISLNPIRVSVPQWKNGRKVAEPLIIEYQRFTKPGESQAAAVKRLMAGIKRRMHAPDPRNFPQIGSFKSVKDYVDHYFRINCSGSLSAGGFNPLSTEPIDFTVDDVVVCEESDLV